MRRTLRPGFALPLLAAVLAVAPLAARTPLGQAATGLPTARAIIDRHVKEIGGRDAVLAQTSVHVTGTISLPAAGLTGKLEVFHARPNKYLQRMTLPGIGATEEGFDGTVGWVVSPLSGPMLLDGRQLEQRKFDADFDSDLKPNERYESMTTVEKTTFGGRPVYKVQLVRRGGGDDIEFYDTESGLKAGSITTRDSPMGPVQGTTVLSDYKKFGPLLQAATTKVSAMSAEMVLTITSVEYSKVDPSVFAVPAQIKALVR
jgi:hypothetical protein